MFDSPIVASVIRSAVVPGFIATILILVCGFLKDPWRARLQALVIAVAFGAGAFTLIGRLNFPPGDVNEAFTWAALLLALFVFWSPKPLGARYLVRGLFVLALGALVLWPLHQTILSPVNQRNLLAFFCLALGVWSIVENGSGRVKPTTLVLLPLIAAVALSLLLLFKSSASMSQMVTVMCAILGGLGLLALFAPGRVGWKGLLPYLSVFLILFMVAGHFYLDINPWHMVLLCLPFFVMWIREWLGFVPSHPVIEPLVLGAVSAAPLAYFLHLTAQTSGPLY